MTRLAAKGYNQVEGFDFFDTLSLVAKITIVRTLLILAYINSRYLHQLDVKHAFYMKKRTYQFYKELSILNQIKCVSFLNHSIA